MTKVKMEIEFDTPYPELEEQDPENKAWLCAENLQLALRSYCKNTNFNVREL